MRSKALSRLLAKALDAANTIAASSPAIKAYSMAATARRSVFSSSRALRYAITVALLCALRRFRAGLVCEEAYWSRGQILTSLGLKPMIRRPGFPAAPAERLGSGARRRYSHPDCCQDQGNPAVGGPGRTRAADIDPAPMLCQVVDPQPEDGLRC